MVTDQWVDDDYYVGEDGAMVTNGWVKALEDDEEVDNPEDTGEHWYYFNAKGKKITGAKKTIGGKTYHFDEDGKMLSGWQQKDDTVYYLGTEDEGWETRNQWRWLEKSSICNDEDDPAMSQDVLGCTEDDDCDDEGWYWFDASGKLYHKTGLKTIKGKKFFFNDHGQMLYEWVYGNKIPKGSYAQLDSEDLKDVATTANMMWFQENGDGASNGARYKGWQYISGSEALGKDGDTNWYYFKDGKPRYANKANDLTDGGEAIYRKKEKISWDGKSGYFCFDQYGKMKTGLQYIEGNTYFFNDDGYMQTGKVSNVEEANGDTFNYYFNTKNSGKGQGYTGEKDGYLYFNGKGLEADDDYRIYAVNGAYYVVNNKGKLQKTFNKKDLELAEGTVEEDVTLAVNKKNYKLTETDFVKANAVLPHIQLEDTDNWIVGSVDGATIVLDAADTDLIDGLDILTYDAALAKGVDLK